jgi:hypothetical protein
VRIASILPLVALSCSRPSATVEAQRGTREVSSECPAALLAPPSSWVSWPVASPTGEFRLPSSFHTASTVSGQQRWVGRDSSDVSYTILPKPPAAVVGKGGLLSHLRKPSYRLEGVCRVVVGGHLASIATFRHVDSAKTDTVFGLAAAVPIRERQFADVLALTPTAAMRDSLLSAVASFRWR